MVTIGLMVTIASVAFMVGYVMGYQEIGIIDDDDEDDDYEEEEED